MKTIEKILEYHLTAEEIEALLLCGMINGCGGEGGFNFDDLFDNIDNFKNFDFLKSKDLRKNIKFVCFEHDLDYRLYRGFYISNFKMCIKIFKLLNWATLEERIYICLNLFILLNKFGKKFYFKS